MRKKERDARGEHETGGQLPPPRVSLPHVSLRSFLWDRLLLVTIFSHSLRLFKLVVLNFSQIYAIAILTLKLSMSWYSLRFIDSFQCHSIKTEGI